MRAGPDGGDDVPRQLTRGAYSTPARAHSHDPRAHDRRARRAVLISDPKWTNPFKQVVTSTDSPEIIREPAVPPRSGGNDRKESAGCAVAPCHPSGLRLSTGAPLIEPSDAIEGRIEA